MACSRMLHLFFLSMLPLVVLSFTDVPAIITMGDSLVDCGNNNNISSPSIAKANHYPYGVDFPPVGVFGNPTGRFANGLNSPDFIANCFGLPFALPFLSSNAAGTNLLQGINLASGGAGILDSSSAMLTPYNMTQQFIWLDMYLQKLRAFQGNANANARINKSLVLISVGSNDYSYKSMNSQTSGLSDAAFRSLLVNTMDGYIQALYSRGFRRIQMSGLGAIGCTPIQITLNCFTTAPFQTCNRNICNDNLNQQVSGFNPAMQARLTSLKASLPGVVFFFQPDSFNVTYDAFKNPTKYGFQYGNIGCCGNGTLELGDYCTYMSSLCLQQGRDAFVFFDSIHPSTKYTSLVSQALCTNITNT